MDVSAFKKSGGKFWDILMGKPLCVSVYYIVTDNPNIEIEELKQLQSFPSMYIMDNRFYYGEYEIIGNEPLPGNLLEIDYPIMYGRSISYHDLNKICYYRGKDYREIALDENKRRLNDFKNNGIGWSLNVDKRLAEECIEEGSNRLFWENTGRNDLRNPLYEEELTFVMKQMGINN